MRNVEIAWIFYEIADLMEFKGEDFFKIRAYRQAAKVIAGLDQPVAELYDRGLLKNLPGLGKNIIAKIGEILASGSCESHLRLKQEIPVTLLELMTLPGLGPKKVRLLYEKLGVTSIAELEKKARSRKVRELPGMGSKTEQEIIRGINRMKKKVNQLPLGVARELARELVDYVGQMPGVDRVTVTGELRRWTQLVSEVVLLVTVATAEAVDNILESFIAHPGLGETLWCDEHRVKTTSRWGVQVELIVVPGDRYWYALLWSTGSSAHFRRLQIAAWKRGWRLDQYGLLSRSKEHIACVNSEEDIYKILGMQFVPPELRENNGEITAAASGNIPRLLGLEDIRGDLHVHTNWSDGTGSIEEMAERARNKGYSYLAVTDHSVSLKIARGLSREKLQLQHEKIRELNEQWQDFHLFTGIEVDILADGKLDFPDDILTEIDVVVASIHSGFKQDRETLTKRMLSAIQNEHVDIIGHPTGRLLGHREPYAIDVEEIIEAAASYNKVLEINASPDRLDLDEFYVQLAAESGVMVAINTDAHSQNRLNEMIFGVSVARRAWLGPHQVLNALPLSDLLQVLQK